MQPSERHVDIGDAVIGCLEYTGDGPPLLMLHATGFLPWLWHPIARQLAGRYRVVAPFFCNHRDADPENGGLSWELLANDLVRLCRRLDIENPFVVGHSMGGALPAIAAGDLGMDVAKMVLIEPIVLPEEVYGLIIRVSDHPLASKSIKRRQFWQHFDDIMDYLKSKRFFHGWDPEMLLLYAQHGFVPLADGGYTLSCLPPQEAALFMGSMAYNPWPAIAKVGCPVLVLEGENTENKGFINFRKAAETFPLGRYQVVGDAGHLIPMEQPGETLSIIEAFFAS